MKVISLTAYAKTVKKNYESVHVDAYEWCGNKVGHHYFEMPHPTTKNRTNFFDEQAVKILNERYKIDSSVKIPYIEVDDRYYKYFHRDWE